MEVTLERVDPNIDFEWVRNGPGRPIREDDFTARWTGRITPAFSEEYTFEADADDFMRVWVGDRLVVDQWDPEAASQDTPAQGVAASQPGPGPISLSAGRSYPIRVEYLEREVNAWARLYWSSASQSREIVPAGRFRTGEGAGAEPGLRAEYRSLQETLAYTRKGNTLYATSFRWPDEELTLSVPPPDPGMRVVLLGREGDLPWRYEGETLIVDLSAIRYSEIPGAWAWTFRLAGFAGAPHPLSILR